MKKLLFISVFLFYSNTLFSQVNLRQGSIVYGDVLYNWDGTNLRSGSSTYGDVLINLDATFKFKGNKIINWDGKNIRHGTSSYSDIIYNTDGKIPTAILIYIIE